MTEEKQSIARCPHCGGDAFIVNESEVKTVRFLPAGKYPFCDEEELKSEGKGWDVVICERCNRDLDPRDILRQIDEYRYRHHPLRQR